MAIELSAAGNFQRPRASSQASKVISGRCRHWPVDCDGVCCLPKFTAVLGFPGFLQLVLRSNERVLTKTCHLV
jgi:hypothetical protein